MPIDPSEAAQAVAAKLSAVEQAAQQRTASTATAQLQRTNTARYVRPCSAAFDDVVASLTEGDDRIRLGLFDIDVCTRGFGPKELILVTGFAHSAKTQLALTLIVNNLGKRIVFFSMDDPAEMVLLKLACMLRGESAEDVERRLRAGDAQLERELRSIATDQLRNLLVVDASLSLHGITEGVAEATAYWGGLAPECVILDFLGSMQGVANTDSDNGIKAKVAALKAWVKDKVYPTIVLHQNTRGRGAPGEPITMLSGAYGGEQEATMVLGVRRQRDWEDLSDHERRRHAHLVTLHVAKNKRPPGRVTSHKGVDLFIEPLTGLIRPIREDDVLDPHGVVSSASQAVRHADYLEREAA